MKQSCKNCNHKEVCENRRGSLWCSDWEEIRCDCKSSEVDMDNPNICLLCGYKIAKNEDKILKIRQKEEQLPDK